MDLRQLGPRTRGHGLRIESVCVLLVDHSLEPLPGIFCVALVPLEQPQHQAAARPVFERLDVGSKGFGTAQLTSIDIGQGGLHQPALRLRRIDAERRSPLEGSPGLELVPHLQFVPRLRLELARQRLVCPVGGGHPMSERLSRVGALGGGVVKVTAAAR